MTTPSAEHLRVTGLVATVAPWIIVATAASSAISWYLVGRLYPDVASVTPFLATVLIALLVLAWSIRRAASAGRIELTGLVGISYLLLVSLGFTVVAWEIGQGLHFSLEYCALAAVGSVFFAIRPWHFVAGLVAVLVPPTTFVCTRNGLDPIARTVSLQFALNTAIVSFGLYLILRHANARVDRQAEEIRHEATHDGLTGVANRSHWMRAAAARLDVAHGAGEPVTLMVIDVDAFKTLNDTWGHDAGDRLLVCLADVLRRLSGPDGLVGRLGGDEFLVLLPGLRGEMASLLADRMRRAFAGAMSGQPGTSFSVGLIACEGRETLPSLLSRADARMYRDKRERTAPERVRILFEPFQTFPADETPGTQNSQRLAMRPENPGPVTSPTSGMDLEARDRTHGHQIVSREDYLGSSSAVDQRNQ